MLSGRVCKSIWIFIYSHSFYYRTLLANNKMEECEYMNRKSKFFLYFYFVFLLFAFFVLVLLASVAKPNRTRATKRAKRVRKRKEIKIINLTRTLLFD